MKAKFSLWIKRVQETQDDEINCSTCLDQISEYVDRELAAGDAMGTMPLVHQHLNQCQVCREEYHVLQSLARMEAVGDMPVNDELFEQLLQHPRQTK